MLDRSEFAAWFRLLETPGVGRDTARALLTAFGSPERVFSASAAELHEQAGPAVAQALAKENDTFSGRLAAALAWWAGSEQRCVITLCCDVYPPQLLQSPDPPLLLYVQGDLAALKVESVAVVGSRHASAQGLDHARAFAQALAEAGYLVVSGLA